MNGSLRSPASTTLLARGTLLALLVAVVHCGGTADGADAKGGNGASGAPGAGLGASGGLGAVAGPSASGGPGAPACATAESGASRVPVYLDIVLDGSRSMDGHGESSSGCDTRDPDYMGTSCFLAGAREVDPLAPQRESLVCHKDTEGVGECGVFRGLTGKKWIAIRGALRAFFDAQKAQSTPELAVGLYLFESSVKKPADAWDVPLGAVDEAQASRLWQRIAPGTWPKGGTPLRASIDGQAALLRAFTPAAPLALGGRRAILLVTDGVPNGSSTDQEVVDAVKNARNGSPPVVTAVMGVGNVDAPAGNVYNETFLSTLASEGGVAKAGCNAQWDGQNPGGTTPCHVQVTPGEKDAATLQAEFTKAINGIAESLKSCELTLSATSETDPGKVNVVLADGAGKEVQVPKDANNGWTYKDPANPGTIVLNGSACSALKADAAARVTIVVGCATGTAVR